MTLQLRFDPPEGLSGGLSSGTGGNLRLPKVILEIRRGSAKYRWRRVSTPVFLIGRATDCDLVLGDPRFPEAFAYLYVKPGGVSVRRMAAEPLLSVDGQLVESSALSDGSRLRMGGFEFAVHIDGTAPRDGSGRRTDAFAPGNLEGTSGRKGEAEVRALLTEIYAAGMEPAPLTIYPPQDERRVA
jgi:predicted component of type VI protein secretion system